MSSIPPSPIAPPENTSDEDERILRAAHDVNTRFNNNQSVDSIKADHEWFYSMFPALFTMCASVNYDAQRLNRMIALRRSARTGECTSRQASIKVGGELVDTYVKPILPS